MAVNWARHIIHTLHRQGVAHFCLAPGSRSTPLAIAVAKENVPYSTHFDERGLGYLALGLAKGSKSPVAIIVTSGTAVGNLLPSVMEAWHDHVPLILLTADRPPELRDCGANQTTDQVKMFSNFVHFEADLPCPFAGGEKYLVSQIAYGLHLARDRQGPVHFNCMFREPLYVESEFTPHVEPTWFASAIPQIDVLSEELATELQNHKQGLVICGENADPSAILLAERLDWPLFAEVNSNMRGISSTALIPYYEHLIKSKIDLAPTAILHCGGRLLSKTLMEWCKNLEVNFYAHIDDKPGRFDPYQMVTHRYQVSTSAINPEIFENTDPTWLAEWKMRSGCIEEALHAHLDSEESCSEPGLAHALQRHLGRNHALFLPSSMPIRDANFFFYPKQEIGPVFSNRGLSGIDGNIATVAGIAKSTQKPTVAILGDLAALHDLNSIALIAKSPVPILLIVINNQGGAIFSFLPHLAKAPRFEELFAHDHPWQFEKAAEMFNLPHLVPKTLHDLHSALASFCNTPKTVLLELHTERTANLALHKHIETLVNDALLHLHSSSNSGA